MVFIILHLCLTKFLLFSYFPQRIDLFHILLRKRFENTLVGAYYLLLNYFRRRLLCFLLKIASRALRLR
jgi:hypothetical protein